MDRAYGGDVQWLSDEKGSPIMAFVERISSMRKGAFALALCLLVAAALALGASAAPAQAYADDYVAPVKVKTLSKTTTKATLYRLSYEQLKVKGASTTKLNWKSSKSSVASVSKSGKAHAKKKGTTTLKCKYQGKTYKVKLTVKTPSKDQRLSLAKAEAKRIVKKLCPEGMSKGKKLERIFRYLMGSCSLQTNQSGSAYKSNYGNEAYACLLAKKAACSGYCKAAVLVYQAAGFKVKHVNANKWAHQWNEVKYKGKWVHVDAQAGIYDGPYTCVYLDGWFRAYNAKYSDGTGYYECKKGSTTYHLR